MPDVQYLDDGRIIVFYHSQAIEITDKFNENGVCYTTVSEGDKNFYMTIEKNDKDERRFELCIFEEYLHLISGL